MLSVNPEVAKKLAKALDQHLTRLNIKNKSSQIITIEKY